MISQSSFLVPCSIDTANSQFSAQQSSQGEPRETAKARNGVNGDYNMVGELLLLLLSLFVCCGWEEIERQPHVGQSLLTTPAVDPRNSFPIDKSSG